MGMEGEAADLLVKECIQIAEATLKLGGAGAKNVAAFFYALSKEPHKLKGMTNMEKFAKNCDGPAKPVPVKQEDLKKFSDLAKSYGVLCAPVKLKNRADNMGDMLVRPQDAPRVNRILERMGYPTLKEQETEPPKNSESRAPQEPSLEQRGSGWSSSPETRTDTTSDRPSVKGRLAYYAAQKQSEHRPPQGPEIPIKKFRGGHSRVD